MSQLVKVAEVQDLPAGKGKGVEVAGKKIALFNVAGQYYAIGDSCTHRGASLCEGTVNGTQVICPWHGAAFDLASGKALTPPAKLPLPCYKVEVEGSEIKVEIP
ncbi:MAG: non-heme iron oxygenase ferredoxin subunit [Planctomycetes bacterium]|nr:non-heme iron oxygenase ferredoxin subunit [Planctomycetota bacterium]